MVLFGPLSDTLGADCRIYLLLLDRQKQQISCSFTIGMCHYFFIMRPNTCQTMQMMLNKMCWVDNRRIGYYAVDTSKEQLLGNIDIVSIPNTGLLSTVHWIQ